MSEDHERVRQQGGSECRLCDEPIVIHRGDNPATEAYVPAIANAVDHCNRHPSNTELEGHEILYTPEEGYYPGEWSHYVDLSEIPEELRHSASINIMGALPKRGLMVNSVKWDPPRLHVMGIEWMNARVPGMGDEHR